MVPQHNLQIGQRRKDLLFLTVYLLCIRVKIFYTLAKRMWKWIRRCLSNLLDTQNENLCASHTIHAKKTVMVIYSLYSWAPGIVWDLVSKNMVERNRERHLIPASSLYLHIHTCVLEHTDALIHAKKLKWKVLRQIRSIFSTMSWAVWWVLKGKPSVPGNKGTSSFFYDSRSCNLVYIPEVGNIRAKILGTLCLASGYWSVGGEELETLERLGVMGN